MLTAQGRQAARDSVGEQQRTTPTYAHSKAGPFKGRSLRDLRAQQKAAASCSLPVPTKADITKALVNLTAARALARTAIANASQAQQGAYRSLVQKLRSGHRATFVAIGGSMVRGAGCNDPAASREFNNCSYPNRLAEWLRCKYGAGVHFANRATGGTPTSAILPQIPSLVGVGTSIRPSLSEQHAPPSSAEFDAMYRDLNMRDQPLLLSPDFALIDFSVNDRFDDSEWGNNVTTSRVAASTEALLRYLLAERPMRASVSQRKYLRTARLLSSGLGLPSPPNFSSCTT